VRQFSTEHSLLRVQPE